MIRISFLVENKTERPGCLAEWGLSIYLETEDMTILFDGGATGQVLLQNAKQMHIDLAKVEAMVISHGHYDHTQGVLDFCRINSKAKIYLHQEGLIPSYHLARDGSRIPTGILWTEEERNQLEPRMVFSDGELRLKENIVLSGSITPAEGFVSSDVFYHVASDGELEQDSMRHERILVIRRTDGLYIFSGCSHTGVEGCLREAKRLFPGEPIALLVAGMHLIGAGEKQRKETAELLLQEKIKLVMPIHCTGIVASCELKAALGERCILPCAGSTYRYE